MRISFLLFILLCCSSMTSFSQTQNENSGWFMFLNSTKINKQWSTHLDVQFRTQDEWDGLKNFLFRPGITYSINEKNDITVGYLLAETFLRVEGTSNTQRTEHRIWQQYIFKHKISTISASHRFRLEQRFIEQGSGDDLFAQRFRYFARFILPLAKGQDRFEKGAFVALQNEVFLNIQNRDQLNGCVFDQNRAYGALGYRLNKKLDLELGYLNQAVKGARNNTMNHAVQLAVYTRF